jgi:hypothetical protein
MLLPFNSHMYIVEGCHCSIFLCLIKGGLIVVDVTSFKFIFCHSYICMLFSLFDWTLWWLHVAWYTRLRVRHAACAIERTFVLFLTVAILIFSMVSGWSQYFVVCYVVLWCLKCCPCRAVARHDNWRGEGCIFIYSNSHTVKTIAFKRNPSGRTRIYEYTPPPPPIIGLAMPLCPCSCLASVENFVQRMARVEMLVNKL